MKKVLLIAGTVEARQLAAQLVLAGHRVWASVATSFGAELLTEPNVTVLQGRKDKKQLQELLQQVGPDYLIDASHPFAQVISANAMAACQATEIPYIRLERAEMFLKHKYIHHVNTWQEAASVADSISRETQGNIFLTIGSNNLGVFIHQIADFERRLFVRVLPVSDVLEKCERLGLNASNILAAKGPFSTAMNVAFIRHYGATVMVSKDSGEAGGLTEKLQACVEENITLVLLRRPELVYPLKFTDADELISYLER